MAQTFTSSGTSINRTRLPAVYNKATFTSDYILDYGCGKYTDHIKLFAILHDKVYLPYDPYNQPNDVNMHTFETASTVASLGESIDVVCSNVLNVIDSESDISRICSQIEHIAVKTGGTAFVTVYEGDKSGTGRQTGKDQYQRNEPLRDYLRFFHNASIRNGMIIVKGV